VAPILWALALAVFLICVGMLPTAEGRVPSGQTTTIAVRVSQADTLWSIAAAHRLPGVSTSEMVELISTANSLQSSAIRAGAVLRVPAEAPPVTSYAQVGDSALSQ
jgi:Tfp pilus assembly protein FimV